MADELGRTHRIWPGILTCRRPYFRAFHWAWLSFFFAFMGWFAVGAAVPDMLESGRFTQQDIDVSTTLSLVGTILIRFALGPVVEAYGPRRAMFAIVFLGGLLVMLTAAVNTGQELMAIRFFISFIGGAFVPCQFWMAMMFSSKGVGTASGLAAGWGNTGAGVVVFLMGALIAGFAMAGYGPNERWRFAMLVPGLLMVLVAVPTLVATDDCPQGDWKQRVYATVSDRTRRMLWLKTGRARDIELFVRSERAARRFWSWPLGLGLPCVARVRFRQFRKQRTRFSAFFDWRAWMVGFMYAIVSGVELSILTGLPAYYRYEFGCNGSTVAQLAEKARVIGSKRANVTSDCFALSSGDAAQIASIFGFTNIYGRALGGYISDVLASPDRKWGLRGRHFANFVSILVEGVLMVVWAESFREWRGSAAFLVLFSTSVHVAKGAVTAIAPFVDPMSVGSVMGVVSAVGNTGGVLMSLMYGAFPTSRQVYVWQGVIVAVASVSAFFLPVVDPRQRRAVWLFEPFARVVGLEADEDAPPPKPATGVGPPGSPADRNGGLASPHAQANAVADDDDPDGALKLGMRVGVGGIVSPASSSSTATHAPAPPAPASSSNAKDLAMV